MNLFDVIVVLLAAAAAIGGYRLGFLARVTSWIGLGLGLYLAARFLPRVDHRLHLWCRQPPVAGRRCPDRRRLRRPGDRAADRGPAPRRAAARPAPPGGSGGRRRRRGARGGRGAVAAAAVDRRRSPVGRLGRRGLGAVARWVSVHLPQPPNTLEALRRLVGPDTFPQVFAALHPGLDAGPPPSTSPLGGSRSRLRWQHRRSRSRARRANRSRTAAASPSQTTDRHQRPRGGRGAPGRTEVLLPGRRLPAKVVLFDPERDLALLSGAGPRGEPAPDRGRTGRPERGGLRPPRRPGCPGGQPGADRAGSHRGRAATSTTATRPGATCSSWPQPCTRATRAGRWSTRAARSSGVAFAIAPDQPGDLLRPQQQGAAGGPGRAGVRYRFDRFVPDGMSWSPGQFCVGIRGRARESRRRPLDPVAIGATDRVSSLGERGGGGRIDRLRRIHLRSANYERRWRSFGSKRKLSKRRC